jgi:hypothetical protein
VCHVLQLKAAIAGCLYDTLLAMHPDLIPLLATNPSMARVMVMESHCPHDVLQRKVFSKVTSGSYF